MDFISNFFRWGNQNKVEIEEPTPVLEKTKTRFKRPKPKKVEKVEEIQEVVEIDDA
jgi:hypothetical protein|tara:strand:+ start:1635 stop:1802 length:168 start_codon:yes stop_codon:yes gene_type:complete